MKSRVFAIVGIIALLVSIGIVTPQLAKASDYDATLILNQKDSNWQVINADTVYGTLEYNESGALFQFNFSAAGLELSTSYSLIYYADKPDRFVDWGGNNPGKLIWQGTSTETGTLDSGDLAVAIDMNLPSLDDANIDEYDYCVSDSYATCHGAKIWLVPTDCYIAPTVTLWQPSRFLFETDLILYQYEPVVPIPSEGTIIPATIGATISPSEFLFGTIQQGDISDIIEITITNNGSVDIKVSVYIQNIVGTLFTDCFEISSDGSVWVDSETWSFYPIETSKVVYARLNVPAGYSLGTSTATIFFLIQVAP